MKKITSLLFCLTVGFGFAQDPASGPTDPIARNSYDIKSIYNGIANPVAPQYTNEPNGTFDSFGGSTIVGDVLLADGNTVIKYTNHLYSGIRAGAGDMDITGMTMLHIDAYSPDFTTFAIKLEAVNGSFVELAVPGAYTQNAWNSYDLDLSTYSAADLAHLKWIVPVTYNPPGRTLYLDNVYFYRPATAGPSPTFNSWTITDVPVGTTSVAITPVTSNSSGAITYSSSNSSVATISNNDTFQIVGPGTTTITASQEASAPYLAGSTTTTLTVAAPIPAAPTPPARPAADVKSIFSDAYTNVATLGYGGDVDTYNTTWCPGNTSLVTLGGNPANKVVNLGCEGVAFQSGRFDATSFTTFHMDIFTETATMDKAFTVKFSNWSGGAGETNALEYSVTNANFLPSTNPGAWISLDIPISSFNAINGSNKTDFVQFVIASDLGTVYYDNLYLHKNTLATSSFEANNARMYPNPSSDILTIDAANAIDGVSIINLLGQEVVKTNASVAKTQTINIADLQSGIYIVKLNSNGVIATQRLVKK